MRALVVLMNGRVAGELSADSRGVITFRYESSYLESVNPTPLSCSLALVRSEHDKDASRAYLSGLLPENSHVLSRWCSEFQKHPTDLLGVLEKVGMDCPGAIQFVPEGGVDDVLRPRGVTWLSECDVADRIRSLRKDPAAWRYYGDPDRFTLAGTQGKFALLRQGDKWALPTGGDATTHIFKSGVWHLDDQEVDEHLCMQAARNLGMNVAKVELMEFDGEVSLVVERFDRAKHGKDLLRVHQEDLCQAMGLTPNMKYQERGGPSPSQTVDLLRSAITSPDARDQAVADYIDSLILNWVLACTDGHMKNSCLLHSGAATRLGPMYDVASYLPYSSSGSRRLKMASMIGDTYYIDKVNSRNWRLLATQIGVDEAFVMERVSYVTEHIEGALSDACARIAWLGSNLPVALQNALHKFLQEVAARR